MNVYVCSQCERGCGRGGGGGGKGGRGKGGGQIASNRGYAEVVGNLVTIFSIYVLLIKCPRFFFSHTIFKLCKYALGRLLFEQFLTLKPSVLTFFAP